MKDKPNPPTERPAAWSSQLWPHLETIRSKRRTRKTWELITRELATEFGVKVTMRTVRNFFKRASTGKVPLGFETTRRHEIAPIVATVDTPKVETVTIVTPAPPASKLLHFEDDETEPPKSAPKEFALDKSRRLWRVRKEAEELASKAAVKNGTAELEPQPVKKSLLRRFWEA